MLVIFVCACHFLCHFQIYGAKMRECSSSITRILFFFFLQFKRFNAYDKSHTQPFAYDTFTPKLDTSSSFVCLFIRLELMMKDYF